MTLERFWYYTRWTAAANERAYAAPADPGRLVAVSPADVESSTGELSLLWGLGRIQGGDWDRDEHRESIRENRVYRGLEQRFVDGAAWEDTDLYAGVAERFETQDAVRGYESLAEFRDVRLSYLDDLYAAVRDEGYRPNAAVAGSKSGGEIPDSGHEPADATNEFEAAYANHLEPLVAIGRDGELIWTEGYHRFTIADLLDVDTIPVSVLCRHPDWQQVRDDVHREATGERPIDPGRLPDDLRQSAGHPDLGDLLERS